MQYRSLAMGAGFTLVAGVMAQAQVTVRVSVDSGGIQGDSTSTEPAISADGRYVAFRSGASNFSPPDTNPYWDIFVRDRDSGAIQVVSIDSGGMQANGSCWDAAISADGRYVAFWSPATNLLANDANGSQSDVFLHDRQTGMTEVVSVDLNGAQAHGNSFQPSISPDGRYVAFGSDAGHLVSGDANGTFDVFLRDRHNGTTELVSVSSGGIVGNGGSRHAVISADGRYVAFASTATNFVPGDTNGDYDVFVRDRQTGTTELISIGTGGLPGNAGSHEPSISADGRYVAFWSLASDLVPGDSHANFDVFVRDRQSGTTEMISVDSVGMPGNGPSREPSMSADGRYVAFSSSATNLVSGGISEPDIFVRDRQAGTTERVSVDSGGVPANSACYVPAISADGRWVTFSSIATNLVGGDTNTVEDVFLHDRDATSFVGLCDPSVAGVIACPCANPPAGPGRGCDNSGSTGGAVLSASGIAYLTMDTLVFATAGEMPTATSTVLQGDVVVASGLVFGQGVRCAGGALKRLYVKVASGGSITAPDLGAGDPSVSTRSAALGDPIQPGETRWYFVAYRDPVVLGGCPVSSKFNATQAGRIGWSL